MAGKAPDPEEFCRAYPHHPELLAQIRKLDKLRHELDELGRMEGDPPPQPDAIAGFRLVEQLGQGGMGFVYLAERKEDGLRCALKLLKHATETASKRFAREAKLAASLSHPGIARVLDFGVEDGIAYLASELIEGFTLLDMLKQRRVETGRREPDHNPPPQGTPAAPLRVRDCVRLVMQVADALAYAHEHGIIHRDIKPSNIIVTPGGEAKLIDFGIARAVNESDRITRTGIFVGSHDYASPEQLLGQPQMIGTWTDTYALGSMLYEMLTDQRPFEMNLEARRRLATEKPMPPRKVNPNIPREIDAVVTKALMPLRKKRFNDAAEMKEALGRWLRRTRGE